MQLGKDWLWKKLDAQERTGSRKMKGRYVIRRREEFRDVPRGGRRNSAKGNLFFAGVCVRAAEQQRAA